MPSFKNLVRRDPGRPGLRQRAAALRDAIARAVKRTPRSDPCDATEPAPIRRDVLVGAGAALSGTILGCPAYRVGFDLTAAAEGWIADARELGLLVMRGPDGNLWRVTPYGSDDDRAAARDRHWIKLHDRPPLQRAVYRLVENSPGFGDEPLVAIRELPRG